VVVIVSVYLHSSCNHVRRVVRYARHALKVVMLNDRDIVYVILLTVSV
jgi:formaldehyde-activating enzyme involved in methanogenesis